MPSKKRDISKKQIEWEKKQEEAAKKREEELKKRQDEPPVPEEEASGLPKNWPEDITYLTGRFAPIITPYHYQRLTLRQNPPGPKQ